MLARSWPTVTWRATRKNKALQCHVLGLQKQTNLSAAGAIESATLFAASGNLVMNKSSADPIIYSFADAPWYVCTHLLVALIALLIGIVVLLRRKGTASHKILGWSWVVLMIGAAISSFFIQSSGHLSLIHVLSVVVLISVPRAVIDIRKGNLRGHKIAMISTFAGLVIAGAFTLLPSRMLGQLVFG
ncbi:MAG: hypothetical protein RLZZ591_2083 [Pseudomonadota bacterium]|jgi:uncharacterized membrane protein